MSVRTLVKSIQDIMRQDTGVDGDAQRISQLCWMFFLKIIDDQDTDLELAKDGYVSPIPTPLHEMPISSSHAIEPSTALNARRCFGGPTIAGVKS